MILGKIKNFYLKIIYIYYREMGGTTRKWSKTTTTTPQRNSAVSDSGKPMEKLMCSYW
jgi:hypothetical protein